MRCFFGIGLSVIWFIDSTAVDLIVVTERRPPALGSIVQTRTCVNDGVLVAAEVKLRELRANASFDAEIPIGRKSIGSAGSSSPGQLVGVLFGGLLTPC